MAALAPGSRADAPRLKVDVTYMKFVQSEKDWDKEVMQAGDEMSALPCSRVPLTGHGLSPARSSSRLNLGLKSSLNYSASHPQGPLCENLRLLILEIADASRSDSCYVSHAAVMGLPVSQGRAPGTRESHA